MDRSLSIFSRSRSHSRACAGAATVLAVWACTSVAVLAQNEDTAAPPPPRVALVIGNSAYLNVTPLPNPANDAQIIAEKLWESGFEVIESTDADRETMLANLATFRSRLREGSEAVMFYAGHGVQIGSQNFLLPVSVSPTSVEELMAQSIDAQLFVNVMNESGAKLSIILIDACRNNPFAKIEADQAERIASRAITTGASRQGVTEGLAALAQAVDGGLAEMVAGKTETLISFATAPGSVALDGSGRHSPYTQAIANNIDEAGLEIGQLFRRVRGDVRETTGGNQITWTTSTLEGDFYFKPPLADQRGATTGMATATDTLGALPPQRIIDRAFWRAIKDTGRIDAFEAYVRTQPDGAFVEQAEQRIAELGGPPQVGGTPALPASDAPQSRDLQIATEAARDDANETLVRADIVVPIGAGTGEVSLANAAVGWVYVPIAPRLGVLSAGESAAFGTGGVYWAAQNQTLDYSPVVGSNGGVETITAELLLPDGKRDDKSVRIEAFVHACDLLAGMPFDSQRVTAGAHQFIVNQNFDAAIVACEIAVETYPDVPRFWAELARAYRAGGRYEEALKWQLKAVDADYLAAVVNLGQMYLDGQAVEKDNARAIELFNRAASRKEPAAYTALGWVYRAGVGVDLDYAEAMRWYVRGAEAGNDWAMANVAELYQTGKGVPRDSRRAVQWYTTAAKSGELTAQTRLARMYQTGDGIEKDFAKAKYWYETAAGRGVPNALTRLGIMYEEGLGQDPDTEAAFRLYTRAAAGGDDEALVRLAKLYSSGNPLFDDPARAVALLQSAVDRKVAGSYRALASLYETGHGVPKDAARALDLYKSEAEKNPSAARDVGRLYASADSGLQDLQQAAIWYEISAKAGSAWAARDLARLYETGQGVGPDQIEALIWYATAIGLSDDAKLRALIEPALANFDQTRFVAAAQTLLNRKGGEMGPPDGKMGRKTRAAIEQAFVDRNKAVPGDRLTIDDLAALTQQP